MDLFDFTFSRFWLVLVVFGLDMYFGYYKMWWKHPVCYVGDLLKAIEPHGRKLGERFKDTRLAGFVCLGGAAFVVGFVVWVLTSLPYIGWIFWFYLAYAGLSSNSLFKHYNEALEKIEHAPIEEAQSAVAQMVSRDTTVLDRDGLRKTLADTFSENFTDAIVAPLFWLILGGPVGLWVYKTVSTMDSMWGYKTDEWRDLGFAGAKADDIMAYIPARLTIAFYQMANQYEPVARSSGGKWPGARVLLDQARGMPSPNSGIPMACAAWLMGARLGGPSIYFGEMVEKPWLGPPEAEAKPWDQQKLKDLATMTRLATYFAFASILVGFTVLMLFVHML